MTTASVAVPADYEELARRYGNDIKAAVHRCLAWASPQDQDNIVQYILQQFLARDVISLYNPEFVSERPDQHGSRVSFRSFLLGQVPTYCRGQGEALRRHYGREVAIADVAVGDGRSTWIEGVPDDSFTGPADLLDRLRAHLAERPAPETGPPLVALFDDLAGRAAEGRAVTEAGIGRRFRLDAATAAERLAELRRELRTAVARRPGEPVYDVGGMSLTAKTLQWGIDLLKGAPGNQVFQFWDRAGHPLAELGKTWYVPWAKQELSWFPQLRGTPGGHHVGGHGSPVKRALIHRLERVLSGEQPPATPLQARRRPAGQEHYDNLEAALWQMPGSTPQRVDDALALIQMMWEQK